MTDSTAIQTQLQRIHLFAHDLAVAAQDCVKNFQWMNINTARQVALLDFNIVYAGFRQHSYSDITSSHLAGADAFENLFSPHTLRTCLDTIEDFTLPPGSLGELLLKKKQMDSRLSDQARAFYERLLEAKDATDPMAVIRSGSTHGTAINIVRQEFEGLATAVEDRNLLDIIYRRSIPIESLIDEKSNGTASKTFASAFQSLNAARPDSEQSNTFDAFNVAYVVKMFKNPATYRNRRPLPILISQTKPVVSLEQSPDLLHLSNLESISLVRDRTYLILSQAIAQAYGDSIVVVDAAKKLRDLSAQIADCCFRLLDPGRPEQLGDNRDWMRLEVYEEMFMSQWGTLVGPLAQSSMLDRAEFLNFLLSPQVTQRLGSEDPVQIKNAISSLVKHIEDYRHPVFDIWDNLVNARSRPLDLDVMHTNLPRTSLVYNDGKPLSRTQHGTPLQELDRYLIDAAHDLRVAIHPAIETGGAVAAFDSWRRSFQSEHFYGVVWLHQESRASIWAHGLRLLERLGQDLVAHVDMVSCLFSSYSDTYGQHALADLFQLFSHNIDADEMQYFQLSYGPFCFYANLNSFHEGEMRAGLVMPSSHWTESAGATIAEVIAQTGAFRVPPTYYGTVFRYINDALRGVEPINADGGPNETTTYADVRADA